jgi:Protein of unknown function (DUF3011)
VKPRTVSIGLVSFVGLILAAGAAGAQSVVQCESRDYQYQFCATPDGVTRARLVEQRSRSACIEGRSWGYDRRGIWVSGGCDGLFEYQGFAPQPGYRPGPMPGGAGHLVCESREYEYNLCQTGRIRNAQIVRQISQAPCIQGQTWGISRDGIWVDRGCEAEFRIIPR